MFEKSRQIYFKNFDENHPEMGTASASLGAAYTAQVDAAGASRLPAAWGICGCAVRLLLLLLLRPRHERAMPLTLLTLGETGQGRDTFETSGEHPREEP